MAKNQASFINEILHALKSIPKTRLRIARDIIGSLAETSSPGNRRRSPSRRRKSLLDTSFCGMWRDRKDIRNGRSYSRTLRQALESRGDRNHNLR
jgi:hypothetical protein